MAARRTHWPILLLLLIIMLAAALRFWRLGDLPPGLYHDEAYYGLDALSLLRGEQFPQFYEGWELYAQDAHATRPAVLTRFPVFFEGNYGREPLHVYLVALSISLLGNTPEAIRSVAAAAGTLAVFTTWLAARALFPPEKSKPFGGEMLPLLAAFSLAVLYPALHFSRFGIRAMTLLPLLTLAVHAFWRGWRGRSSVWLAMAGFFTGLSLYTFASARLFPLVFICFGVYLLWSDRLGLRERWRGLALATVVAFLTAAPLLLFFARYPYFFLFRMTYVANRGKGVVEGAPFVTWLLNVGRVVGGLLWKGETHLRHNLPGRPYMDPAQATLFGAGIIWSLRRRRQPEYIFLILWFAIMLLPSIMSGDAPHFGRLTGVAPAVAILIGVGGVWLVEAMGDAMKRPQVATVALLGLCAISLILTTRDYFIRYAAHPDLARDFYLADWKMGQSAASRPVDTVLYLSPSQEEMATIYFALADPDRIRSFNGLDGIIPAGVPGRPSTYYIRPKEAATVTNLKAYFPDGRLEENESGFLSFYVPAGAERITTALRADHDFGGVIKLAGYTVEKRENHLLITLAWQAMVDPDINFTGFVHLIDSHDTLVSQTDRPPLGYPTSDWRPEEIVVDRFRLDLPPDLQAGTYRLQTGFYEPATVARLGVAASIGEVEIP